MVHLKGQSPTVIFLPSCDLSHIPGSLDPVAFLAEDLKIIYSPLITTHSDWPDVIQDVVMMSIRTSGGVEFMDLLFAPGALPFLLKPDKSPHFGNRGPLFTPILPAAGGLAAEGILVPGIKVYSLTATKGTGPSGEALLLFRSIGIPAIFTKYHVEISPS